jgi:PLP dependent protein
LSLAENYSRVQDKIHQACITHGRAPESVQLIAVSKTYPAELVAEAACLGQKHFGENRIHELIEKRGQVTDKELQWHLIGQLQTNKVKLLTSDILLHTLDRISLANTLEKQFTAKNEVIEVCLQVNCSGEVQKSGVLPGELWALADAVAACRAVRVVGLMTMAEDTEDRQKIRAAFAKLRELSTQIQKQCIFPEYRGMLSMGMSGDFAEAIAEGATHIRIGTALFGER